MSRLTLYPSRGCAREFGMKKAVLILAACLLGGTAEGANRLKDGGFETPLVANSPSCGGPLCAGFTVGQSIGPWSVVGPGQQAGDFAILLINSAYAEGSLVFEAARGSQAIDLTGSYDQGANGVEQSFATTPGKSYDLSFAVGHADRDAYLPDSMVEVTINGTDFAMADNGNVTPDRISWKRFSYRFTATGASTTVALYNASTNSNYVGLDAVDVEPVTPPSSDPQSR
jgi:hypothetical protein